MATKQAHSSAVSRSRATTPSRSTHGGTHARPTHARPRPEPVPNPMPTKHVAPPRPVLVTPEHARVVMEVYIAADRSAETNLPVTLPLPKTKTVRAVA